MTRTTWRNKTSLSDLKSAASGLKTFLIRDAQFQGFLEYPRVQCKLNTDRCGAHKALFRLCGTRARTRLSRDFWFETTVCSVSICLTRVLHIYIFQITLVFSVSWTLRFCQSQRSLDLNMRGRRKLWHYCCAKKYPLAASMRACRKPWRCWPRKLTHLSKLFVEAAVKMNILRFHSNSPLCGVCPLKSPLHCWPTKRCILCTY